MIYTACRRVFRIEDVYAQAVQFPKTPPKLLPAKSPMQVPDRCASVFIQ